MVQGVKASSVGGPALVARDGTRTAQGTFSIDDHAAPSIQNARLSAVTGIDLDSMLALQAVDERAERDRSARKRATAMVAALTDLQRATLSNEDGEAALLNLSQLAANGPPADDPALGAILRAIVLRSRVEIARREKSEA
jgi:hypothetical protein